MSFRVRLEFLTKAAAVLLVAVLATLPAFAQKSKKPMTKAEVLELLQNGVSSTRVDDLVRAYGIAFELTPEVVVELQDAGAHDDLIKTLKEISSKPEPVTPAAKPEPAPPQSAPAPPSPPVLMLETTPPGAEVYVDEERVGKTGPGGKLKVSTLAPGEHKVRISAPGFDDLSQSVELTAGQTNTLAVALAPQKPVVPEPQPNPQPVGHIAGGSGGSENPMDAYKAILSGMAGENQGDPNTKRFYVTHDHGKSIGRAVGFGGGGMCYGWLIIGKDRVQFSSNNEDDAFDVPANEITELRIKSNHLRFRIKDKKYHLMTQDMGMLGGDAQGPGSLRKAFESVGLRSENK
ncbi:MAG: PEGA domain-containing protein [Acidobacteria bacterium]|nr:PEGA domain-containing protein [Acidobacteriota bacterium]